MWKFVFLFDYWFWCMRIINPMFKRIDLTSHEIQTRTLPYINNKNNYFIIKDYLKYARMTLCKFVLCTSMTSEIVVVYFDVFDVDFQFLFTSMTKWSM